MNKAFKLPPVSPSCLTSPTDLAEIFKPLLGTKFSLTGKSRTDGSNVRKLIARSLEKYKLPEAALEGSYEVLPPKGKGVPKITREFIDTYIVTTGKSYNLQVWNRIPSSETLLLQYVSGENLKCNDVRFVFVKIDPKQEIISSIIILTTDYILENFGNFGVPTVKHQLRISNTIRNEIYRSKDKNVFFEDTPKFATLTTSIFKKPLEKITDEPKNQHLFSLNLIKDLIIDELIGFKIPANSTKNRGQELERKVAKLLGYTIEEADLLFGGFPDIPNQLLEIKIQDSQTVDLGKFSPEKEEIINEKLSLSTFDIRYLIALTDPETEVINAIILSPGKNLGDLFSYISDQSYKCQRTMRMSFFEEQMNTIAVNPSSFQTKSIQNALF